MVKVNYCSRTLFSYLGASCSSSIAKNFVMFSDRHQLSESSIKWFDPIKHYVSGVVGRFCLRASSTFIAGASTWFHESWFLNLQLKLCADALMFGEQCWETNMTKSHSLFLWVSCKKVRHMCLILNLIPSNCSFQLCLLAKFFVQNRDREFGKKWHWNESDFEELGSFGLRDSFCRLKLLRVTIYSV